MEQDQKQYEAIFILSPQLEEVDLDNAKKEISETINKLGGTINFKESEKRTLAYPINKQSQGIFLIGHILISSENLGNLSRQLKFNKQILRHIINQLEIPKTGIEKPKPEKFKPKKEPSMPLAKKDKTNLEEIDKKLDELIGL